VTTETIGSLARFARRVRRQRAGDGEAARCELCAAPYGDRHRHVVDRRERRILCACAACALAFEGDTRGRHRTVPERVRREVSGAIRLADLQRLGVPVGLAFFFRSSTLGRTIGVFPSPAGATEAELDDEAYAALAARSALAAEREDDVEALLVRSTRAHESDPRVFLVPIDVAYELVAVVRRGWRGIDGGEPAQAALDAFFGELDRRAEGRQRERERAREGDEP
jgi:hypothetical protein